MPSGAFRRVVLLGRFAIKLPRWRNALYGIRCNRWEREMWRTWRPLFGWQNLCPITFADPLGLVVVMPRAHQPVSYDEVVEATPYNFPEITAEAKPEDFGRIGDHVFALDYGLPYVDAIVERRALYGKLSAERVAAH